jgi:hypothetical protein
MILVKNHMCENTLDEMGQHLLIASNGNIIYRVHYKNEEQNIVKYFLNYR